MAPVHGSIDGSLVASPMVIMLLLTVMALTVVASLLVVALICACGGKKKEEEQPTVEEQQRVAVTATVEQPQEQAPAPESTKEVEDAKTAVEAASRTTEIPTSKLLAMTPELQLTSQKPGPSGVSGVGVFDRTSLPSLKLMGSPNSSSVDVFKGSGKSLKSTTVKSKTVVSRTVAAKA